MKYNAYGKNIEVIKDSQNWSVYYLGTEGKKRTAYDIVIPFDLEEKDIENYLEDILHEWANPSNNKVIKLK